MRRSGNLSRTRLTIVVAASENGVIGRDGGLPWRLPADLARFKQLTTGHCLIMGRKTYESIGRPLPGRVSIVLTRDDDWRPQHDEVRVASDLDAAIEAVERVDTMSRNEAFIIGGGEIYRLALPHADRVHLTRVHAELAGEVTFPSLDPGSWRLITSTDLPADDRNEYATTVEDWRRMNDEDQLKSMR